MEPLLNAMTVFSLALIVLVIVSLRRAHIRVEYSMSWLGAAVALLILSRSHGFLKSAARFLGIGEDPQTALALLILCVLFVVSFRFSVVISRLKDANIALAQKMAVLEFQIRKLDEKRQTPITS